MKPTLFFLVFLICILGCNNNKSSSSSDSTSVQNIDSKNDDTTVLDDTTIVPSDEYGKIVAAIEKCNISKQERFYLNIALQRSKRFDQINDDALSYYKAMIDSNRIDINNYKDTAKFLKFDKTDTSYEANKYFLKAVTAQRAVKYLKNFRKASSIGDAMRSAPNDEGVFSLLIGKGDGNNPRHSGFRPFTQQLALGGLNGIRIYLAKYTGDPTDHNQNANTTKYTLIVVGTKDGADDVDLTSTASQIVIQNYGKPCKPGQVCSEASLGTLADQ